MSHNRNYHKNKLLITFAIFPLVIIVLLTLIYATNAIPQEIIIKKEYKKYKSTPYIANQYLNLWTLEVLNNPQIKSQKTMQLIRALRNHINEFPMDQFNSQYLSSIGSLYKKLNANTQANYFFNQSIYALPTNSKPIINEYTMQQLLSTEFITNKKIQHIKLNLTFYPENTDINLAYFTLGTLYDSIADWKNAYLYYEKLLQTPVESLISIKNIDIEEVFFRIQRKRSPRTISWNTLEETRQGILWGLNSRNTYTIKRLQAPGFFTAQWQESPISSNSHIETFDIVPVLARSNLRVSSNFQYINDTTVLWDTYGWERVGTWYMVIRKIQQPDIIADNGKWEWAGIYFGESNTIYVPQ